MSAGQRQIVFRRQHGQMARAGIEPDVENVGFLAELGAAAFAAVRVRAHQFGGRLRVPDVGGVLAELLDDAVENRACR